MTPSRLQAAVAEEYWNCVCIPLTKGKHTIIDIDDYAFVSQRKWQAFKGDSGIWYARASFLINGKRNTKRLHQVLLNPSAGKITDHRDFDGLNNRRENLREATKSQNSTYRKTPNKIKTSLYKGVTWRKESSKWGAQIKINCRTHNLGWFDNEEDAAVCYNMGDLRYYREFAILNMIPARLKEVA